jgi:nitric oxide reductase large subunit
MVAMGMATAALRVAYFAATITFISGITGTTHHYLFKQLTG